MKKQILCIMLTIFTLVNYAQTAVSKNEQKLNISTTKSKIEWSGEYAFYFGGHNGTIDFKEGHFTKSNEVITGGEFIIDMNSIVSLDIENKQANKGLVDHLKNEDFFDVKKFPEAKLVITKVRYHNTTKMKIYANLTIKDVTLPIDFQAKVDYEKKELTTKLKIDRTLWNITYQSKEKEGKLKDNLISDAIEFHVKLAL